MSTKTEAVVCRACCRNFFSSFRRKSFSTPTVAYTSAPRGYLPAQDRTDKNKSAPAIEQSAAFFASFAAYFRSSPICYL